MKIKKNHPLFCEIESLDLIVLLFEFCSPPSVTILSNNFSSRYIDILGYEPIGDMEDFVVDIFIVQMASMCSTESRIQTTSLKFFE